MWYLGGVALVSIHYTEHNSVIFAPRSFKLCVVVHIEVTDKLENISKRGVAPRGSGTFKYTRKSA